MGQADQDPDLPRSASNVFGKVQSHLCLKWRGKGKCRRGKSTLEAACPAQKRMFFNLCCTLRPPTNIGRYFILLTIAFARWLYFCWNPLKLFVSLRKHQNNSQLFSRYNWDKRKKSFDLFSKDECFFCFFLNFIHNFEFIFMYNSICRLQTINIVDW